VLRSRRAGLGFVSVRDGPHPDEASSIGLANGIHLLHPSDRDQKPTARAPTRPSLCTARRPARGTSRTKRAPDGNGGNRASGACRDGLQRRDEVQRGPQQRRGGAGVSVAKGLSPRRASQYGPSPRTPLFVVTATNANGTSAKLRSLSLCHATAVELLPCLRNPSLVARAAQLQ